MVDKKLYQTTVTNIPLFNRRTMLYLAFYWTDRNNYCTIRKSASQSFDIKFLKSCEKFNFFHFFTLLKSNVFPKLVPFRGMDHKFRINLVISVCNITSRLTLPYFLPYHTCYFTVPCLTSLHLTLPYHTLCLPYLTLPYITSYLTLSLVLPYLTSYVTLCLALPYILPYLTLPYVLPYFLPYLTLPYLMSYLTLPYFMSYLTSCLTLPYFLPYLTLPYLTIPYLTLPYLTSYLTSPYLTNLTCYLTLPYKPYVLPYLTSCLTLPY